MAAGRSTSRTIAHEVFVFDKGLYQRRCSDFTECILHHSGLVGTVQCRNKRRCVSTHCMHLQSTLRVYTMTSCMPIQCRFCDRPAPTFFCVVWRGLGCSSYTVGVSSNYVVYSSSARFSFRCERIIPADRLCKHICLPISEYLRVTVAALSP